MTNSSRGQSVSCHLYGVDSACGAEHFTASDTYQVISGLRERWAKWTGRVSVRNQSPGTEVYTDTAGNTCFKMNRPCARPDSQDGVRHVSECGFFH